ncbi:MAG: ABC transporter ATP-binding protein [Ginsengibacter sp.]
MKLSFKEKYFDTFFFFYQYIGKLFFIMILASLVVGFLDGIGLSLFIPLLKISDGQPIDTYRSSLGKLSVVIDAIQWLRIPVNVISMAILISVIFIIKGVARFFEDYVKSYTNVILVKKLRIDLMSAYKQLSYRAYLKSDTSTIANTLTVEITRANSAYYSYSRMMLFIFTICTYLFLAVVVDARFTILILAISLPFTFFFTRISGKTRKESVRLSEQNKKFHQLIIQNVTAFKYLKSTNTIGKIFYHIKVSINDAKKIYLRLGFLSALVNSIREPIVISTILLSIIIQIYFFHSTLASLIIVLLLLYRATNEIMQYQSSKQSYLAQIGGLDSVRELLTFLKSNREVLDKSEINSSEIFTESFEFKNVSFSYDDGKVLENINFRITPKKSIAIVGTSGSGKTTLLDILTGLLLPAEGDVLIDGNKLDASNKLTWQSKIGVVNQDPVIFQDTVFNNVTLWDEHNAANELKCVEALKKAIAFDFIMEKKGLHEQLSDRGMSLSGGQKQRIAIARELYKNSTVLILDEATSALDTETEFLLQENILKLQGKVTLIIVAHRLSTIKNVDKVLVLSKGKVIEFGDYNLLKETKGSYLNTISNRN